jgi:Zn-dependent protease
MADQPAPTGPNTPPPSGRRPPGAQIGRVRGVPLYVSPMTLVFAVVVATLVYGAARNQLPAASPSQLMALAAVTSVGFILSLVLHELGHAMTALRFGLRVRSVTIHGFAGFTEIEPEPKTAVREFLVGFSGPFVNGVLAALCFLALIALPGSGADGVHREGVLHIFSVPVPDTFAGVVLFYLAITNLALFLFNCAPGLPLDGGRLVVAIVWGATRNRLYGLRAGAYGGFVVAGAIVVQTLGAGQNGGFYNVYMLALAAFIGLGAYQSLRSAELRQKLPDLRAGRLVRKTLPVEGSVPLAEALRHAQQVGATAISVVDQAGNPVMIMNGSSVDALPEHRRPWVSVADVSRTIEPGMILDADLAGEDLLNAVQRHQAPEYLVTQDGRPVGVLVMVDLIARFDRNAAVRMAARH